MFNVDFVEAGTPVIWSITIFRCYFSYPLRVRVVNFVWRSGWWSRINHQSCTMLFRMSWNSDVGIPTSNGHVVVVMVYLQSHCRVWFPGDPDRWLQGNEAFCKPDKPVVVAPNQPEKFYIGWWFGCNFLFSHTLGMSSSQLTNIFQRGGPTTKQFCCHLISTPHFISCSEVKILCQNDSTHRLCVYIIIWLYINI